MKKYNIIILIAALFGAAVLQSCSEDEGNYDYVDLNDVEILDIEDSYTLDQFKSIKIRPTFSFKQGYDESNLEYLWYMYPDLRLNDADTLSKERNLDIVLKSIPANYNARYKVTDKETGIYYDFKFRIKVTSVMSDGLVILSEIDKKANIAMLNASGTMYQDAFYTINNEYAGENPVGLGNMNNRYYKGVLIFCDDKNGGCVGSHISFDKIRTISDLFWVPEEFPKPVGFFPGNWTDFMITEKGFYHRSLMSLPPLKYGYPLAEMSVFPVRFQVGLFGLVMYDNKSEGFKKYRFGLQDVPSMPDALFDPAHIGMQMLAGGDGYKKEAYGLFYDDEKDTYYSLISAYTSGYNKKFIPETKLQLTSAIDIDKATCFDLSTVSPQYFYSVGNKLYCLNAKNGITKLVYSFDSGVVIDHFELEGKYDDLVMYIGTSTAGSGKIGSLHTMSVALNGSVSKSEPSHENIAGKIIDFMYKEL